MSYIQKEKLIEADIRSIENKVRHAFNQGYDLGFKDGKGKLHINRLIEEIEDTAWYHLYNGKLIEGAHNESDGLYKASDIKKILEKYRSR